MIIRNLIGGGQIFLCPGCNDFHSVNNFGDNGPKWTYNNDPEKPTFTPSILVTCLFSQMMEPGDDPNEFKDEICHSYVTDGKIQFLNDCTHKLAGQTVDLPQWPYKPGQFGGIKE